MQAQTEINDSNPDSVELKHQVVQIQIEDEEQIIYTSNLEAAQVSTFNEKDLEEISKCFEELKELNKIKERKGLKQTPVERLKFTLERQITLSLNSLTSGRKKSEEFIKTNQYFFDIIKNNQSKSKSNDIISIELIKGLLIHGRTRLAERAAEYEKKYGPLAYKKDKYVNRITRELAPPNFDKNDKNYVKQKDWNKLKLLRVDGSKITEVIDCNTLFKSGYDREYATAQYIRKITKQEKEYTETSREKLSNPFSIDSWGKRKGSKKNQNEASEKKLTDEINKPNCVLSISSSKDVLFSESKRKLDSDTIENDDKELFGSNGLHSPSKMKKC